MSSTGLLLQECAAHSSRNGHSICCMCLSELIAFSKKIDPIILSALTLHHMPILESH